MVMKMGRGGVEGGELTRRIKASLSSSFLVTRDFCCDGGGAMLMRGLYDMFATLSRGMKSVGFVNEI